MKQTSIKTNFAYQMIYEIMILILPFVTSPYIARVVGAEGLGIYSYSYSVAYYFVLFSLLGIKNYGNREIAKAKSSQKLLNRTFSEIFIVHAFFSVLCVVIYIAYLVLISGNKLYAIVMLPYVISGFFDISWFYFGIEKFKVTVLSNTLTKVLTVICIFVFVKQPDDLWCYCLIMAIGFLLGQLILWIPLRRYVRFVPVSLSEIKIHLKPLLILFIPAIAVSLYKYMDKIMIGMLNTNEQLGFYENAEKVINLPVTVIASFGTVMLPKMSSIILTKDTKHTLRYITLSMSFVMCLAFGLAFGLMGVGKIFAIIFWGKSFEQSGILIMGLATTIPFVAFANVIRTQYLIPNSKDREFVFSVIMGAVVNLIINRILIPGFGAKGAMMGTIVAEITVCAIQTAFVKKQLPVMTYIKECLFFLIPGMLMGTLVYYIGLVNGVHISTLFVQVFIGGATYMAFAIAYYVRRKNPIVIDSFNKGAKFIRHIFKLDSK